MSVTLVKDKTELAAILLAAMKKTRVFSATNVLLNGEKRTWNIHPNAGNKFVKGTGKPLNPSLNMVHVYDMTRATVRDAKGRYGKGSANAWRTLRLDTLQTVKVAGVTYALGV